MNYNENKLKHIILKTIFSANDLENIIDNISNSGLVIEYNVPTKIYLNNLDKYFLCIENELLPVANLEGLLNLTNQDFNDKISDLADNYLNGVIAFKKELLINDYNFKVFYNTQDYRCYKNKDNIKIEIDRIINSVDKNNLFKELMEKLSISDSCSFFLTVNNNIAGIFKSEYLGLFSNLLNYSKLDISRIKNFFGIIGISEDTSNYCFENWDDLSEIFRKFLKEINIRNNSLLKKED